jgi:hypothetical protein
MKRLLDLALLLVILLCIGLILQDVAAKAGTLTWKWECVEPGKAQVDAAWHGDLPADSLTLKPGGGSTFTIEVWRDSAVVYAETQEVKGCESLDDAS